MNLECEIRKLVSVSIDLHDMSSSQRYPVKATVHSIYSRSTGIPHTHIYMHTLSDICLLLHT
jgi:hypothetical protein